MNVVEAWGRDTARAAGTAAMAPLMVLLAVGLMAFGGGLGGLDSLSQVAAGPALPAEGSAERLPDLFAAEPAPVARAGGRADGNPGTASRTTGARTRRSTRTGSGESGPRARTPGTPRPRAPSGGGKGEPGGAAPPAPGNGGPLRAPANTVGEVAHGVTDAAPAPAGPLGGGVVDSVTDAAGRLGSPPG